MNQPSALPTTTSEGKCSRPDIRLMLIVAASAYIKACAQVCGYSCAITEAVLQLSVACVEGNEALPGVWKNFPWPSKGVGLWRAKTSLRASLTARLLIRASA